MHKSYIESTAMLPKAAGYSTSLRDEDIVDALLVNAIHDGVEAVHEASVKESETAGTTLCSLFLVPVDHQKHVHGMRQSDPWQPPQADVAAAEMGVAADCGRSYKVLCANIGDSRCVMVGCSAEPIKVVRKSAIISRGNSVNNLAAMAAESKASPQAQPTLSLYPTARTFSALSSNNLFALGDENKGSNSPSNNPSRTVWNMQSPKESDSSGSDLFFLVQVIDLYVILIYLQQQRWLGLQRIYCRKKLLLIGLNGMPLSRIHYMRKRNCSSLLFFVLSFFLGI